MAYNLKNQTLLLYTKNVDPENQFFLQVLSAENAMMDEILGLPKYAQWILIVLAWMLALVTTYFRSILYSHLIQKYRKKEFNAINILIFVDAILEQSTLFTFALSYSLIVVFDAPLKTIVGPLFCYPVTLHYRFVTFYSALGSLGISIYRILLLKHEVLVKYTIGLENTMYIILASGISLAAIWTYLISITDYEVLFKKTCTIIQPEKRMVLDLLNLYELSRGNPSIYAYWRNVRIPLSLCLILITIAQIVIYVIFFHHMYTHDNAESLRRLLDENVIKLRNRRNGITFLGHFFSFVFELTFNILLHLAVWMGDKENGLILVTVGAAGISSLGGSIVEVLTSPTLKEALFRKKNVQ